ncbi:MAG: N-acetylglucosamine-6-phosphate deacetylase [Actinobacteria bacterium]|nr:N-acetylglucosamine-6-phosphate deacetylase [Actinomycetota bacterium]MCL5447474.1 N-acetylglucosamine-6-phosphate deacetylase [Actinomycetota bacterium]
MDALLSGATVVSPSGVLDPGWIRVHDALIADIGTGDPGPARPDESIVDLAGCWVLPGLVDIHCHGGGGNSFSSHDPREVESAALFHRERGSTTLWASLVSAPLDDLLLSLGILADLVDDRLVAGIHLEGPFLAKDRCGAQNPNALLSPDHHIMGRLLEAGRGAVRMVTVAPELPGALDLIRQVASAGAIPAIGHTDATYSQAMAAVDAGARVATHLFNGMRPIHHRDPGPIVAVLERPEVFCELITDGIHVDPAVIRMVIAIAGTSRVALVSDAIPAAGMPDGDYDLGGQAIEVHSGISRLAGKGYTAKGAGGGDAAGWGESGSAGGDGTIAGSTITAGAGLRWAIVEAGLTVEDAVTTATATPARLTEQDKRCGKLAEGIEANMIVCDTGFNVTAVMAGGHWLPER